MDKQKTIDYLLEKSDDFYCLSDSIWDNAETGFKEKKSAENYIEALQKEGFSVTEGLAGIPTAFKGIWGSGKPVIAFLGEYDALPDMSQKPGVAMKEPLIEGGNGHGCGHNLLGVGAYIGAIGYKKYLETEGKKGTVIFYGCPAEENGGGKAFMAREGCFSGVDCALCWHPATMTAMAPGTFLANTTIRYSFTGAASHAAAAPEKGRSALDAIELMNIGIQFLREHIPSSARIHYALTDTGGISPNIVQSHASGLYMIRAPFSPTVSELVERVNKIAKGAAMMTETEVEIEVLKGTSNTVLIPALDKVVYKNMCEMHNPLEETGDYDFANQIVRTQLDESKIPEKAINTSIGPYNEAENIPIPGSSDTGDVSWVCPLSQFGGTTWPVGTAAHTWQAVACGKTDFAHRGMLFAGQIMAASAIDIHDNPEIISQAWTEFSEKTKGYTYECPIPADVTPDYLAKSMLNC